MPLLSHPNLFTLQGSVDRREYFWVGVVLMLIKYAVEAGTVYLTTGMAYTPIDFLSPLMSSRVRFVEAGGAWLGWAWLLWTMPFVWIAVAMTFRRAKDADLSPWTAMAILVPLVNLATMLMMSLAPSSAKPSPEQSANRPIHNEGQAVHSHSSHLAPERSIPEQASFKAAAAGLAVGVLYTLVVAGLMTLVLQSYGAALFFGAPIISGAACGYVFNSRRRQTLGQTLNLAATLVLCTMATMLLVGLEGAFCILMAFPLLAPLSMLGAVVGREIARNSGVDQRRDDRGMLGALLLLPLVATVEPLVAVPAPLVVTTAIDIQATPQDVWDVVVAFPDIEAPPAWYFRWGIAAPERARIEGHGVGAVRHCEFTTGSFVEPITVWDEPHRLAFDVTDQPAPMFELSPYHHLHPPHLDVSFRSTKGEFRLEALPNGGTRLIGTTWYELDIAPHAYWQLWTDWIVHRIHSRVLEHIKVVAERKTSALQ
jgi:uncharacterized membrane protein YhaH (DUF805 family)